MARDAGHTQPRLAVEVLIDRPTGAVRISVCEAVG